MINLEMHRIADNPWGKPTFEIYLWVNGTRYGKYRDFLLDRFDAIDVKIGSKKILNFWPFEKPLQLFLYGELSAEPFFEYQLGTLPGNTKIFVGALPNDSDNDTFSVILSEESFAVQLWYSSMDWEKEYSRFALFSEFERLFYHSGFTFYRKDIQEEYSAIEFHYQPKFPVTIKEIYEEYIVKAKKIQQEAVNILNAKFSNYPFSAKFKFPDEIKHECEQYLSYFGKFLSDIGLESDTEIKRRGKEILFSVRPKDLDEAIEKISQAFSLFVSLPALSYGDIQPNINSLESQIKFQRMSAAVDFFKSQLKLAEATISAQQSHINTLKQFNENILMSSLISVSQNEKECDGINLLSDFIKVKKFEGKGFEIDLPKLLNKIKEFTSHLKK